jgi:hypothetical protein
VYGVPQDLDLSRFVGATLIQVCLGEYQVQFRFAPTLEIGVEGHWELRDGAGLMVDRAEPYTEREAYRVHRLLGQTVEGTDLDAPRSFALRFSGGEELRIFDNSDQYESFSIQPGNIFV